MNSNKDISSKPICVFDSGLGGLTVVRDLARSMPGENIIYLGDSARVPYGIKSLETVRKFALEDAKFLSRFDPKMLVVACNTASAAAFETLDNALDIPVIDVIRPSAAKALRTTDKSIGIVATEATVRSGAYQTQVALHDSTREVLAVACPLLVPIVEEGRPENDPIVTHVLCDYLRDLQRMRPGALVLGCTHYPLLAGAISKLMGPDTTLISSAEAAAEMVEQNLNENSLQNSNKTGGKLICYTTDNPERFAQLGRRFAQRELDEVYYVGTDELEKL